MNPVIHIPYCIQRTYRGISRFRSHCVWLLYDERMTDFCKIPFHNVNIYKATKKQRFMDWKWKKPAPSFTFSPSCSLRIWASNLCWIVNHFGHSSQHNLIFFSLVFVTLTRGVFILCTFSLWAVSDFLLWNIFLHPSTLHLKELKMQPQIRIY